ncbi:MAG TPA: hypothetical protein VFW24_13675 [Acidimicrobiales bacterium]|nr:hypothetical protein [Acidimicrobiales bacterium]
MKALSVLGRSMAAVALLAVVLLSTGAAASATPGVDPFKPVPVASGPGGSASTGSGSSATTASSGTGSSAGTSSGTGTSTGSSTATSTTPPSATPSPGSATPVNNGSLAVTGAHTMATFLLGLFAIFVGMPMVRAGRRRWDARHWPAC